MAVGAVQRAPLLLVLRALGLGDLCTGVPALRGLADAFPGHRRVLLTAPSLEALVVTNGLADDVYPLDGKRKLDPGARLPSGLAAPDLAVNLHGRGPQSTQLLRSLQPRRLIAFACPGLGLGGPDWREDEHDVARWCRLLAHYGIRADPDQLDLSADTAVAPDAAYGATLLHPGAASAARRWPLTRWVEVARAELEAGHDVVVTGSGSERQLADALCQAAGLEPFASLAGRTDVCQLAAAVAVANRVVSADTGVAHLATALGTPSVVLFGPVSPAHWGPPAHRSRHQVLWAGQHGDPHGTRPDPGLTSIEVADVLSAIASLPHVRPVTYPGPVRVTGGQV